MTTGFADSSFRIATMRAGDKIVRQGVKIPNERGQALISRNGARWYHIGMQANHYVMVAVTSGAIELVSRIGKTITFDKNAMKKCRTIHDIPVGQLSDDIAPAIERYVQNNDVKLIEI